MNIISKLRDLQSRRALERALGRLPRPPVPEGLAGRVMAAIPPKPSPLPARRIAPALWMTLGGALAAAAVVVGIWLVGAGEVRDATHGNPPEHVETPPEVSPQHVLRHETIDPEETRTCDILPPLPA
jgi:hypothetical protein